MSNFIIKTEKVIVDHPFTGYSANIKVGGIYDIKIPNDQLRFYSINAVIALRDLLNKVIEHAE